MDDATKPPEDPYGPVDAYVWVVATAGGPERLVIAASWADAVVLACSAADAALEAPKRQVSARRATQSDIDRLPAEE